jgi:WhiB family redox-sensing transcriptional regulator
MSVPTYTTGGDPMRDGLLDLFGETEWQDRGSCAQTDPEAFFVARGVSTSEAKQVCMNCKVKAECLEYALDTNQVHGVWGGTSGRERRKLKAGRPVPVTPAAAANKAMEEALRLGMRQIDIAAQMHVSPRTVERRKRHLADQAVAEAA